jgi:hypothetical protein
MICKKVVLDDVRYELLSNHRFLSRTLVCGKVCPLFHELVDHVN